MAQQDDDLVEGADILDPGSHEYLCPVCRRLGTTLLPALTPLPPSSLPLPHQAGGAAPALPDQAMQQQEGHTDAQTDSRLGRMDEDRVEDSDTVSISTAGRPGRRNLRSPAAGKANHILRTLEHSVIITTMYRCSSRCYS